MKKTTWVKPRHKAWRNLLNFILTPVIKSKYGFTPSPYKDATGEERQYLILLNHQTAFDQFFVGKSFKNHVYFVASEDLFSMGFISKIIVHATAPIPIKKQTTDVRSTLNVLKVIKEGGTVAIAPEGNRTFSGKTEYIKPSIVKLIRLAKLPLLFYKIEGGYGVMPRWADKTRKGYIEAGVSKTVEYEEYNRMTDEELFNLIKNELFVDETKFNYEYKSDRLAEYLERVLYVCPSCEKGFSTFESKNNVIRCKNCDLTVRYEPNKTFTAINGNIPFTYVNDWYTYQQKFILDTDLSNYIDEPIYKETASLYQVILYKNKRLIYKNGDIKLYADKITVNDSLVLDFINVSTVAVLGKNKVNVYYKDKVYQIKGNKRFNAVKFVNVYYKFKGGEDAEFLGL